MKTINYIWRLFATGFCFLAFSIGGILLSLIVFPIFTAKYKHDNKAQQARLLVHKSFRLFVKTMAVVGVVKCDVREVEKNLAEQRGKIIIANHPSLIDVVVLVAIIPHAVCIVKKEMWNNFFLKGVMRATNYIKNTDDIESLMSACKESLDEGNSIIIFPEGTRTVPGKAMSLQRGASNIALRCQADLVTVFVSCKPSALTKDKRWYNIPPEKIQISLKSGKELEIKDFLEKGKSKAIMARGLTEYIRDYYTRELRLYE